MKRIFGSLLVLSMLSIGVVGCGEQAKVEKETTVSTPEGETTKTETTEVEKSGDAPPATPQ